MEIADVKVFLGLLMNAYKPAPGLAALRDLASLARALEAEPDIDLTAEQEVIMVGILLEMLNAENQSRAALSPAQSMPLLRLLDELEEGPDVAS